ncbi:MAG: hypothetical protein HC785_11105, partial [Calothrix sp. CSU_2_0]|nr:hypothetical protein [Calothrix sp. CSU_2_0]
MVIREACWSLISDRTHLGGASGAGNRLTAVWLAGVALLTVELRRGSGVIEVGRGTTLGREFRRSAGLNAVDIDDEHSYSNTTTPILCQGIKLKILDGVQGWNPWL